MVWVVALIRVRRANRVTDEKPPGGEGQKNPWNAACERVRFLNRTLPTLLRAPEHIGHQDLCTIPPPLPVPVR